jgi:predicted nucleotidyltransferase
MVSFVGVMMQSFSFGTELEFLKAELSEQPYPLLFATVSGAHLYGFPSPDSDYDIRGVHVLPVSNELLIQMRLMQKVTDAGEDHNQT